MGYFRVNNLPGAHLSTFDSSFPDWNLNNFKRKKQMLEIKYILYEHLFQVVLCSGEAVASGQRTTDGDAVCGWRG